MSKGIQFKAKNNEKIYPYPFMPVGSILKSTINSNPSSIYGGTWVLVFSGFERICIGSQVIYDELAGNGLVSKTNLLGAYNYTLFSGLFKEVDVPTGCHKEYKMTFQGSTSGDTRITMFLNNISTGEVKTWSANTFREIGSTRFFKESDITLETTMGYSNPGTNLKYQVTGTSNSWQLRNVTVHGYITTDVQIYTWRRTA